MNEKLYNYIKAFCKERYYDISWVKYYQKMDKERDELYEKLVNAKFNKAYVSFLHPFDINEANDCPRYSLQHHFVKYIECYFENELDINKMEEDHHIYDEITHETEFDDEYLDKFYVIRLDKDEYKFKKLKRYEMRKVIKRYEKIYRKNQE